MLNEKRKTRMISFSGKGGSGKSTTCSMLLANIVNMGIYKDILVIDADPDANLSKTLNVEIKNTVGQIVDKRKKQLDENEVGNLLRYALWETICQGEGFDLLVMGRPKGVGCYCSVNTILNTILSDTLKMYEIVIVDFDAGLEHFARRAGSPSDTLIVTCDPSSLSFDTARRIKELVEEISLPYTRQYLVGCRYSQEQKAMFEKLASEAGYDVLGLIPYDEEIASINLKGESILTLDKFNPAMVEVNRMTKIILDIEQ